MPWLILTMSPLRERLMNYLPCRCALSVDCWPVRAPVPVQAQPALAPPPPPPAPPAAAPALPPPAPPAPAPAPPAPAPAPAPAPVAPTHKAPPPQVVRYRLEQEALERAVQEAPPAAAPTPPPPAPPTPAPVPVPVPDSAIASASARLVSAIARRASAGAASASAIAAPPVPAPLPAAQHFYIGDPWPVPLPESVFQRASGVPAPVLPTRALRGRPNRGPTPFRLNQPCGVGPPGRPCPGFEPPLSSLD